MAISVDTPEESRDLCRKAGYTFPLLSDPNLETIRRYDLFHKGANVNGGDVARPAEFLLDHNGIVRWRNLTGDLRVRARPDRMIEEAQKLR